MVLPRHAVVFVLASMLCVAPTLGCTGEPEAARAPELDPSLPHVDAPWNPAPGVPGGKLISDAGAPDSGDSSKAGRTVDASDHSPFSAGELLITEVMYDPSGSEPASEWFEVHNTTSAARSLSGLTIVDGAGRSHVIGDGVAIAAKEYVVLARSRAAAVAALVPESAIIYEYGAGLADSVGVQLANSATGGLSLRDGDTIIAQADYGGWFPPPSGASIQLRSLTFEAGDKSTSWCVSEKSWAVGSEKGTPGAPGDCP